LDNGFPVQCLQKSILNFADNTLQFSLLILEHIDIITFLVKYLLLVSVLGFFAIFNFNYAHAASVSYVNQIMVGGGGCGAIPKYQNAFKCDCSPFKGFGI
jgi:hypothetical protein